MDDLINQRSLLECAEYDDKGRLVIPYRKVKNAPTAFDKEKVIEELRQISEALYTAENYNGAACIDKAIEIVEKGGIE